MANISVANVLDGDFCDPCVVLRQGEAVGDDGVAVRIIQRISIFASIQASGSDRLEYLPDSARVSGMFDVITTFPLAVATDTTNADIVLWGGRTFVVTQIDRFGNFSGGAGHYEGVMQMQSLSSHTGPP